MSGLAGGNATAKTQAAPCRVAQSPWGAEGDAPASSAQTFDRKRYAATDGDPVAPAALTLIPATLVDGSGGTSFASPRRQGREKKRALGATGCAPPPPSSPPPRLARRASQREPKLRERNTNSAGDEDGDVTRRIGREKEDRVRGSLQEQARKRGSRSTNRPAAHNVPPPTEAPPFAALPTGGNVDGERIIQRRNNSTAARPSRCHHRDSMRSTNGRRKRGHRNDSNGSSGTTSPDSSSTSRTSRTSADRGGHYSDGNTSGSSSDIHESGKTYIHLDALESVTSAGENVDSGRSAWGARTRHRKKESFGRDGKQLCHGQDDTSRARQSSKTNARNQLPENKQHHSRRPSSSSASSSCQGRSRGGRRNAATDGRTNEGGGRCARIHNDDESLESNTRRRDSPSDMCVKRRDKARGSETTATPSPRDTHAGCSGSGADEWPIDDGAKGNVGWLAASMGVLYGDDGGDGIGGTRCSGSTSTVATMMPPGRESTRRPLAARDGVPGDNHTLHAEDSETDSSGKKSGAGGIGNRSVGGRAMLRSKDESPSKKDSRSVDKRGHSDDAVDGKIVGVAKNVDARRPSRGSPGRRKTTHSINRTIGSRRRDSVLRAKQSPSRRLSSSSHENDRPLGDAVPIGDAVNHNMTDGVITADDDDHSNACYDGGSCSNANISRADKALPATTTRTRGGQSSRASTGSWFAVQREEGEGEESKNRGDDNGEDECADVVSNDSCSDNIVSSKRRYHGKAGGITERVSYDEGRNEDGGGGGRRGGSCWGGSSEGGQTPSRCNSLLLSFERGRNSALVQCVIVRDRSGMNRLYPQYNFFFEGRGEQLMMVAQKCGKNRTSNYHVFDMKRGGFRSRLSKKNGNYLGKVRTNLKRTEATIFTNDQEIAQLGAVSFDKPGIVDHLRDGSQPRKFSVLLPALDCDGAPAAHKVDPYDADSDMLSCMKQGRHGNMFLLQSREPTYTNGNYRLNFHGRVTVPSVKNFQLVSPDDLLHTVCQFGKVGEDRFHLDYRAPINAFQAFCISLAQFNF